MRLLVMFKGMRLVDVRAEAVEVAANRQELWDRSKLVPAARVGHLPAEPVDASGHCQSGGVVSRRGEPKKRSGQRVGFAPPVGIPLLQGLVHISKRGDVNRGTEECELGSGKVWRRFRCGAERV